MTDEPGFRLETLSTWEPPDDVAAVREAIFHAYDDPLLEGTTSYRALGALDRLVAKLEDLEHENQELRPYADRGDFLVYRREWDALQARLQAAEAREAALREALERIADRTAGNQATSNEQRAARNVLDQIQQTARAALGERSLRLAVRQAHERGADEAVLAAVAMRSLRWVRRVLGERR